MRTVILDVQEFCCNYKRMTFCEDDLKKCADLYKDSFGGQLSCSSKLRDVLNRCQSTWPSFIPNSQDGEALK